MIEELGGMKGALPIPNSLPQSDENQKFDFSFFSISHDGTPPPAGRWANVRSLDGKGEFDVAQSTPTGQEQNLGPARPGSCAQGEQIARFREGGRLTPRTHLPRRLR